MRYRSRYRYRYLWYWYIYRYRIQVQIQGTRYQISDTRVRYLPPISPLVGWLYPPVRAWGVQAVGAWPPGGADPPIGGFVVLSTPGTLVEPP
jgi:hypothetical protein